MSDGVQTIGTGTVSNPGVSDETPDWQSLGRSHDPHDGAGAWLRLVCMRLDEVRRALVVMRNDSAEPMRPVAMWPGANSATPGLKAVCESALEKESGVVRQEENGKGVLLAWPCLVEGDVRAIVACEFGPLEDNALTGALRQVQLYAGWLEVFIRRARLRTDEARVSQATEILDILAAILDEPGFESAARALVTELALRFDCDRVSLAMAPDGKPKAVALSNAANFSREMNLVGAIEHAAEEAIDQEAVVMWPAVGDDAILVSREAEALARTGGAGAVLSVPLIHEDHCLGALIFELRQLEEIGQDHLALIEAAVPLFAPVLDEKRANDDWLYRKIYRSGYRQVERLTGPGFVGRKLALAGAVFLGLFALLATGRQEIVSEARLEGEVQRSIVAPFDGYVLSETKRAGDVVEEGDVIARLDQRDMQLQRLRYVAAREQHQLELQRALAEGNRADINVTKARIREAGAQVRLLDEMIARATIKAPFDGLVVSGDLSQKVGAPVERGDRLFRLTPLNGYRLVMFVDERKVSEVEKNQQGAVRFASFPDLTWPVEVTNITPVTEIRDGANVFRVEGQMTGDVVRLRPGMEGVVRLEGRERRLVAIWLEPAWNWLRLAFWRWMPSG